MKEPGHGAKLRRNPTIGECKLPGSFMIEARSLCSNDSRKDVNQDTFLMDDALGILGIFDGHGVYGELYSSKAKALVQAYLQQKPDFDIPRALSGAFLRAHLHLVEAISQDRNSGTTALVVAVTPTRLYFANAGDCRAIVLEDDPAGSVLLRQATTDHTLHNLDERMRVLDLGLPFRALGDGRIVISHPTKSMTQTPSRSLGDTHLLPRNGACAVPEISQVELTPHFRWLVLASDGVFDELTNDDVATILSYCNDPDTACTEIVLAAQAECERKGITHDDITCVCVMRA
ncbi:hypothetical protein SPRG_06055 [Saprolegnia parasitica CBS 223.65]|uniref:PPM-type phosphatase domain-containing protein n=1 Tax=Saprolegnia parasitica (strain CBS 223.65) TaxID=695850 RepID=A0A067CDV8_SAPPC|nr:hypothetical protein SPRG_06055 [Saprolegnia parasitica CBS 223.65]KDO28954.1 hypothetical protein SPRG_06055 [Saprolegnia parasitica CBS 223.65]|eukprot:XP_012200170.1 hypothetical protein SPRG_06055 [Saprolegnia parasitica CBS 223.65]